MDKAALTVTWMFVSLSQVLHMRSDVKSSLLIHAASDDDAADVSLVTTEFRKVRSYVLTKVTSWSQGHTAVGYQKKKDRSIKKTRTRRTRCWGRVNVVSA